MSFSYSFPAPASQATPSSHYENEGQKKSSSGDFETFIKLLVTQMKNQDPTEPVDATQYVAQLASFSAVEQAVQTNARLEATNAKLTELLTNQTMSQAGHYIGKQLSSADGKVSGIVQSVTIYGDGLMASLDNGQNLIIGPGVRVSAPDGETTEATNKPADTIDEVKPA